MKGRKKGRKKVKRKERSEETYTGKSVVYQPLAGN